MKKLLLIVDALNLNWLMMDPNKYNQTKKHTDIKYEFPTILDIKPR